MRKKPEKTEGKEKSAEAEGPAPPRALWKGAITFGLVNVPVQLVSAVTHRDIRFHMLHDEDHVRLHQRMVCPADGKEITDEHTVRGYEVAPDQYVIIEEEELDAFVPASSRAIDIMAFVDAREIDPIYYDRPYYVVPGKDAGKAYRLLLTAMQQAGKVAIASFVMYRRQYLGAIRPANDLLLLEVLRFGDEVLGADQVRPEASSAKINEKELNVAQQLIEALADAFEPSRYHDEYRDQVAALIEKKAAGEAITAPPKEKAPPKVTSLLAALEDSLKKARKTRAA